MDPGVKLLIMFIGITFGNASLFVPFDTRNPSVSMFGLFMRLLGIGADIYAVYSIVESHKRNKELKELNNEISNLKGKLNSSKKEIELIESHYDFEHEKEENMSADLCQNSPFVHLNVEVEMCFKQFFHDRYIAIQRINVLCDRGESILQSHRIPENNQPKPNQRFSPFIASNLTSNLAEQAKQLREELVPVDTRLTHLKKHEDALNNYISEIKDLKQKIQDSHIILMENNSDALENLKNALQELKKSKKIKMLCDTPFSDFIEPQIPIKDDCFKTNCSPLMLSIKPFVFYMYDKVILAFDSSGNFVSAISKNNFKISVERKQKSVCVISDSYYCDEIANDSATITTGQESYTWLHTRSDGMPDMRYSTNPQIRIRNDVVEYGEISISVEDCSAKYAFSSAKALAMLEEACATANKVKTNASPVSSLIVLFNLVCDDTSTVQGIKERYYAQNKQTPYCYIEV